MNIPVSLMKRQLNLNDEQYFTQPKVPKKAAKIEDLYVHSISEMEGKLMVTPLEKPNKAGETHTRQFPLIAEKLPLRNVYKMKLAEAAKLEMKRQILEKGKFTKEELEALDTHLSKKPLVSKTGDASKGRPIKRSYSKNTSSPLRLSTKPHSVENSNIFKITRNLGAAIPSKVGPSLLTMLKTSNSITNVSELINIEQGKLLKNQSTPSPVVLPFGAKNAGRGYTPEHLLMHLLFGVRVQPTDRTEGISAPFKVVVGDGNNHKLVYQMLKEKGNVISEYFYSKSNFQWTQLHLKQLVSTPLKSTKKVSYQLLSQVPELAGIDFSEPESMVSAIMKKKIFRVGSERLVRELIQCSIRTGQLQLFNTESLIICNHVKGLVCISQKSKLFETLSRYAKTKKFHVFELIPKTFLIRPASFEDDILKVLISKNSHDPLFQDPLIVKPGENSNRGTAISMAYTEGELRKVAENLVKNRKGSNTALVQFYLSTPLLYHGRKFDIRCYGLVVRLSHRISFYWYLDGYARTSSFAYNVKDRSNTMVHLTNEAIQIQSKTI